MTARLAFCRISARWSLGWVALAGVLSWLPGCGAEGTDEPASIGTARLAAVVAPDTDCVQHSFEGSDYWVCKTPRNWRTARDNCASVGMRLASVETVAENQSLASAVDQRAWLGGSDSANEGEWRWLNASRFWVGGLWGGPIGSNGVAPWADLEPNDLFDEDCLEIDPGSRSWNDERCNATRAYFCEGDFEAPRPLPQPDVTCSSGTYQGHKYTACKDKRPWAEARSRCQASGMDLVSIETAPENDFVRGLAATDAYVGFSDAGEEGVWRWVSRNETAWCGPSAGYAAPEAYTRWASGQPRDTSACSQGTFNGKTYWFCSGTGGWEQGRAACRSAGMDLAQIETAAEQDYITGRLQVNLMLLGAFVGGSDLRNKGTWRWPDGKVFWNGAKNGSAPPGVFARWRSGEPNDLLGEDCLELGVDGKWNDELCDLTNDFVCEGVPKATAFPQTPDTSDCALLAASGGNWSSKQCAEAAAYVCEQVDADVPAPDRDLVDLATTLLKDVSTGRPSVRRAELPPGVTVRKPFLRFEKDLGLRSCLDFFTPGTPVAAGATEALDYTQTYKGVPLEGFGYRVVRDTATKAVRSLQGTADVSATATTAPQISLSQAVQRAAQVLGISTTAVQARKPGRLAFVRKPATAARTWELAWLFEVKVPTPVPAIIHFVAVSAVNQAVLQHKTDVFADCATTPLSTSWPIETIRVFDAPPMAGMFDTRVDTEPHFTALARVPGGTTPRFAISAPQYYPTNAFNTSMGFIGACSRSAFGANPPVVPVVTADPVQGMTVNPAEQDDVLAGVLRTSEFCASFFANSVKTRAGTPFIVPNGDGGNIGLVLEPGLGGARWQDDANVMRIDPSSPVTRRAPPDAICHEMAHAVFNSALGLPVNGEQEAIGEAFSDVSAIAAEASIARQEATLWCFEGDHDLTAPCARDHKLPEAGRPSVVRDAFGAQITDKAPQTYRGPRWCPFETCDPNASTFNGCCQPHHNSSVVSHWFYIVTHGTTQEPREDSCTFSVKALAPTELYTSIQLGYQIVAGALGELGTAYDLPSFATATSAAATRLSGSADSAMVASVKEAWFAVGLTEEWTATGKVTPKPQAREVKPWVEFTWPRGNQVEWELQVSVGSQPTAQQTPLLVSDFKTVGPDTVMTRWVALPENLTDTVYWRVRPRGGQQGWSCVPVYSFTGTGPLRGSSDFKPFRDAAGKVAPGQLTAVFKEVDGGTSYHVTLTRGPNGCEGAALDEGTVADVPPELEGESHGYNSVPLDGFLPGESYWVNVTATGPRDLAGNPSVGPCTAFRVEVGEMPAPVVREPRNEVRYDYTSPHNSASTPPEPLRFEWTATGQPAEFKVRFYRRRGGQCTSTVDHTEPITNPGCTGFSCEGTLNGAALPLTYPGGYCWDVVSLAANQLTTDPAPGCPGKPGCRTLNFFIGAPAAMRPGVDASLGAAGVPAPILDGELPRWVNTSGVCETATADRPPRPVIQSSYDQRWRLEWEAVPGAVGYDVQVAKWPWLSGLFPVNGDCPRGSGCTTEAGTTWGPTRQPENFIDLTAEEGGRGRYCWQAIPVIADPGDPTEPAPDQPTYLGNASCYTTGPDEAFVTDVRQGTDSTGYWDWTYTGEFRMAYVPNSQIKFIVPEDGGFEWTSPECETRNYTYNDIIDCTRKFKYTVPEGRRFTIRADTFNSPAGKSVLDDSTRVHCNSLSKQAPACGAMGEMCCKDQACDGNAPCRVQDPANPGGARLCGCGAPNDACCPGQKCSSGNVCFQDKCQPCGAIGEHCCENESCDSPNFTCDGKFPLAREQVCWACGGHGQRCCDTGARPRRCDQADEACTGVHWPTPAPPGGNVNTPVCDRTCGRLDTACCSPDSNMPTGCYAGLRCEPGANPMCRAQPPQTVCDSPVMAGGNQPLISTIALGRESGTTRFTVNTLMVPDNLVVVHGQDILASTGCVGTEQITNDVCAIFYTQGGAPTFVAPDFPGCNPNTTGELVPGCWCCKGGTCYTDIRYNGGPNMTVAVEPNCAGHPNTAWSFQLSCQSP